MEEELADAEELDVKFVTGLGTPLLEEDVTIPVVVILQVVVMLTCFTEHEVDVL